MPPLRANMHEVIGGGFRPGNPQWFDATRARAIFARRPHGLILVSIYPEAP